LIRGKPLIGQVNSLQNRQIFNIFTVTFILKGLKYYYFAFFSVSNNSYFLILSYYYGMAMKIFKGEKFEIVVEEHHEGN
jgi:hypothetical protein